MTLPANFFVAGKTVRLTGKGVYTTNAIGANIVVKVKLGSTVIATNTTSALLTTGSNNQFSFECLVTCRTTGASGTVMTSGSVNYKATGGRVFDDLDNAGATTTVDTTASKLVDVTVTWDSATATRTITTTLVSLEVLN